MSVYKDFTNEDFYKALADLIEIKKMPVTKVAEKAGITTQYVYQILNKQRLAPNDENMERIAAVFNLKPEYFKEYRNRRLSEKLNVIGFNKDDYDVPLSDEEVEYLKKLIEKHSEK